MANDKYMNWNKVKCALARAKINAPGKAATLLLDTFLEQNARLRAAEVYKKGLCEEGKFYAWRKELCDKGWLVFDLTNQGKVARYFPGKKLMKYINNEKSLRYEIATTRDLAEMDVEIEAKYVNKETHEKLAESHGKLAEKVNKLEAAMDRVINILDPETNEEKREKYLLGGYDDFFERTLQ